MRTYEELLSAQTELMHFNPNHDPKTGRFAKSTYAQIAQKRAIKAAKTKSDVDSIVDSLTDHELYLFGTNRKEGYLTLDQGEYVVKRFIKRHGNEPVAFFDILREGDDLNIALATRHGDKYRGKGYASELTKKGMDWLAKHPELFNEVLWSPREENAASRRLAEKSGFKLDPEMTKNGWMTYYKTSDDFKKQQR